MPPRYAYWTILIDQKPTAFRAKDKEELLPTFAQLQRKNPDVVMKWFARGRLWDNPEQAQWALRNMERTHEKRPRDWRPGGEHKDPRARFDKPRGERRPPPSTQRSAPGGDRPAPGARRPPPGDARRPPFTAHRPQGRGRPPVRKPDKDRG